MKTFLSATWSNLFLATYAVAPSLLEPRLPPGLTLDLRDGRAFVSLVAFEFLDTRVFGVPWPGYRDFAELNLRFYVRRGDERGVVFVREFVPQRLVAWLARRLYNEPYVAAPFVARRHGGGDGRGGGVVVGEGGGGSGGGGHAMTYELVWAGRTHVLEVAAKRGQPGFRPREDSVEHFFKEHRWGFGTDRRGALVRYEVEHPAWDVYPIESWRVDVDWGAVYGDEWAFLGGESPCSVVFAAGSPVRVSPRG